MTDPVVLADGRASLYLADCREVLPTLGKVDAVVTDPPYGMNKGFANDAPDAADALAANVVEWCRAHVQGNVLAFWSAQRLSVIERIFSPKRVMIWNKTFAIYAPNNVGYRYEPLIWVAGKEATSKRGDIFESFPIVFKAQAENEGHETQKPAELLTEIVRDFDIACRRIEDAARQPDMFIEPAAVHVQNDMFYDAGDNSKKSYDLALSLIRERKIEAGEYDP